jgi:selenocysteine lyase/cysteine desulfurase
MVMMTMSRRDLLAAAALAAPATTMLPSFQVVAGEPARHFSLAHGTTQLNSAAAHPMPVVAANAVREYINGRASGQFPPTFSYFGTRKRPRLQFARLINAEPDEIALVQSTTAGENAIVAAMGLRRWKGNIVTDSLHYDGSLYLYKSIETDVLEVRIARTRDFGIDIDDLRKLINSRTRLVALSLVASDNGFMHDLEAVCDLAHANGALVYADIVQAAGAVPIDVRSSNIDFCACGTYKWLMGDCGAGFLYVRKDLLGTVISREQWGYLQCDELDVDAFGTGDLRSIVRFAAKQNAQGYFEVGTPSFAGMIAVEKSLDLILELGVERIAAHIKPLVQQLKEELPRRGYPLMTPLKNGAPIVLFGIPDEAGISRRLAELRIQARVNKNTIRLSPAIFNTNHDIERAISALPRI